MALSAAPGFGHHAAAEFDTDVVLQYEGVIKEFVWANPHIRAILETRNDTIVRDVQEIKADVKQLLGR